MCPRPTADNGIIFHRFHKSRSFVPKLSILTNGKMGVYVCGCEGVGTIKRVNHLQCMSVGEPYSRACAISETTAPMTVTRLSDWNLRAAHTGDHAVTIECVCTVAQGPA